ncbi:hypothetical protein Val02_32470 [Virgisporangium aliadipatigenens]|uniref:MarR family transcriptional regulator n=1 Tax=Virgisporangium aliadipatigenens TaxID=741659 RepID=A0A8J4DQT8_9ACTN|nr:hypothetical protein [Virgisporangium aliadipatigenens]GIJ46361.1 hypothetical protein Val02_32470 [Virgisporangium aliadipatigenens]
MERPIGYWLKRLDGRIETAFARVLAGEQLTRRHWQLLNVVRETPRDAAGIAGALHPFTGVDETLDGLTRRGWIAGDDAGRYGLTPAGVAGYAAVAEKAHAMRAAMADGVTEDDYRTTLRVLRRMTDNLAPGPDGAQEGDE